MAIGDNYGNQNNGLFVTNEDVEKRKLDRERAKKLSQETNRRRKALDDRKRQAADREKRKISLELTKRKQKQTEATERYQRSHFISKSERRPKTTYARGIPSLDNILQQLRSGSTEISYGADSHYSSANRVTNNNQHNSILEQHKLKTKQEFQNELKKNHSKSQEQMIKANDDYNAVYDSLEENSMIDKRNITSPPVPAFGYTNADLMSGSAHLSEQELSHSLSRLFIRNQQYNRPPTYELPRAYSKQTFTGNRSGQPMKIEDADDEEEIVIKSHPSQKFERQTPIVKQQSRFDLADSLDDVEPDSLSLNHTIATEITFDEDSLHGSTTTDSTATRSETENSQPYHHFQQQNPALYAYNNNNKDTANSKHNEPKTSPSKAEKHDHNITSTESGDAWTDDGYYFKAYRPRTATHQQQRDDRSLSHDRPRPMPQHNNVMLKVSSGRPSSSKLPATEIRVVEPWSAHQQQQQPANNPNHRIVPRVSEGIFDKDERSSADASSGLPIRGGEESSVDKVVVDEKKPKSILKKVSKYCSKPDSRSSGLVNYSAATIVRQQWVNEIGVSGSAMSPKTNVQLNKSGSSLFEGKSVKWNEIQYDDGTSTSLLESKTGLVRQPDSNATSTSTSTKSAGSGKSGKGSAKGRGKAAGGRKGSNKSKGSASSRKLKPAKESSSDLAMEPHPPPTKKKQLTSSNALHYSIHNNEPTSIPTSSTNLPLRSKIAWKEPDHGVTLDNLKSSGEQSEETLESKRPHVEVVTSERTGNHVTIHIVTSDCNKNNKEEVVNLSKTPTDQEINQLWENVRSCIAKRSGSNNKINRAPVENQRYLNPSARTLGSRTAWSTQPTVQQQASIVSIDGGMLMHENTRGYSQYRVASQRRRGRRFIRPTSAAVSTSDGRTGETQNFYARHQALLQQRRQKQFMPPSYPAEMMAPNFKTYPGVKTSHQLPTPRSAREQPISNSTTAYLLAEALAEQNLSEEQIMQALESIQRKSFEAQKVGKSLNPSALSMEEQRLLASLERLNSRLDEIESTVSTNPNIGPFTNKNMSLPQHDSGHSGGKRLRRNQSATESRFHRARDHRY